MKNKVQLITYADRLGDGTLSSMTDILRTRFDGVYDGVHILPFFTPFDGADAGFDPIDHTKVDPRLGGWDDVAELSKTHGIMVDAIVNHMSWESKQFQDVLEKGEESEYYPMFLTMSSVRRDRRGSGRHLPSAPGSAVHPLQVRGQDSPGLGQLHPAAGRYRHGFRQRLGIPDVDFRPDGRIPRQLHSS